MLSDADDLSMSSGGLEIDLQMFDEPPALTEADSDDYEDDVPLL